MAGLVPNPKEFMDLLELEPRDIIGTQHIYLTMKSLNECKHRLDTNHREDLEQRLDDWLSVEWKHCYHELPDSVIASHRLFPETLLKKLIASKRHESTGMALFEAIRCRSFISNSLLRLSMNLAAEYDLLTKTLSSNGFKAKMTRDSITVALEKPGGLWALEEQTEIPDEAAPFIISEVLSLPRKHLPHALYRLGYFQGAGIEQLIEWSKSNEASLKPLVEDASLEDPAENATLKDLAEDALGAHWQDGQCRALMDYQINRFEEAIQVLCQSSSKWTLLHESTTRNS